MTAALRPGLLPLRVLGALNGAVLGLYGTVVAVQQQAQGWSSAWIGLNAGLFFAALAAAAPLAAWLMLRRSVGATLRIGLMLAAISGGLALVASTSGPASGAMSGGEGWGGSGWLRGWGSWWTVRALQGAGLGLLMVASQTALSWWSEPSRRAGAAAWQALCFGLGMGLGPLMGAALAQWGVAAAWWGGLGLLAVAAGVSLALPGDRGQAPGQADWRLLQTLASPVLAVLAYASAESTLLSLFPVAMLSRGYGSVEMGAGFAAFVVGSLLSVWPACLWADRRGARSVLVAVLAMAAVALAALGLLPPGAPLPALLAAAGLAGAAAGPLFPLALCRVCELLPPSRQAAGQAVFTAAFGVGSLIGPLQAGLVMTLWGADQLFLASVGWLLLAHGLAWATGGQPALWKETEHA